MSLSPEQRYLQLGQLISEMPDLDAGAITPEVYKWLGRAIAIVEECGNTLGTIELQLAAQSLDSVTRHREVRAIKSILYAELARVEMAAPPGLQ